VYECVLADRGLGGILADLAVVSRVVISLILD